MDDSFPVVVLDNGAYTCKVGLNTQDDPMIMPNCVMKAKAERRRAFIANQIEECRDVSGLFYILCFQKGYLLNWDVQKSVWDHIFSTDGSGITLNDKTILVTEPQLNFASVQESMVEILFEEYHVSGVHKSTTAELAAYNYATESEERPQALNCIVIDVGFSFTHIVPFVKGLCVSRAIRRIEIGGKVLTNHLKELISYRHLNVMDESYVVNQIKEDVCFVSQDFVGDMQNTSTKKRSEIVVDYVLPDFTTVRRGYICQNNNDKFKNKENVGEDNKDNGDTDQQYVRLCNERFTVPELLFNPSDVGIRQVGIAEAVIDCLKDCPAYTQSELLRNILIIGGSSLFPGFISRLKAEIRSLAPDDLEVSLIFPEDPISYGWYGGKELSCSDAFKDLILTREEYEETGYTVGTSI